jgi:hypothetical protein
MDAIKGGGLFSVDVDIVPTKIGQACHVWLPAATSGEMNLTSGDPSRDQTIRHGLTGWVHVALGEPHAPFPVHPAAKAGLLVPLPLAHQRKQAA